MNSKSDASLSPLAALRCPAGASALGPRLSCEDIAEVVAGGHADKPGGRQSTQWLRSVFSMACQARSGVAHVEVSDAKRAPKRIDDHVDDHRRRPDGVDFLYAPSGLRNLSLRL